MVVAGDQQHAAILHRPIGIGMAEGIARAIDPRRLAVPHAEHTIIFGVAMQPGLLATPHGGRGEVFVQARLEDDILGPQKLRGCPQLLIEPAQRRPAIAGDETGGVESGGAVARLLQQGEAHQRLGAGHDDAAGAGGIFIVQSNIAQRHHESSHRVAPPL